MQALRSRASHRPASTPRPPAGCRRSARALVAGLALFGASFSPAPLRAQEGGAAALGSLVRGLGVSARVLVVGAHPDDEDTQLITWLAKGRHVETAYLSLTRGDGGQNLLGNELGEALGAIRTEELLAARRIDGGRQYFTRAFDFGFSKTAEETFAHWPHDSILRDVITAVRAFRPHVITSVFSGTARDGHGHHQAAGILAREAYDLAGDTVRFPRSATNGLGPWTVLKFYRRPRGDSATIRMNVGEYDPLLGRSYAELAGESRSQHKSQAFGALEPKGVRWFELRRMAMRVPAPADPAKEQSIFDGIDTTWARFAPELPSLDRRAALDSLGNAFRAASDAFDAFRPARLVGPLATVQRLLRRLCGIPAGGADASCDPADAPLPRGRTIFGDEYHTALTNALERANTAMSLAHGVAMEVTAGRETWAVGDSMAMTVTVFNRGSSPLIVREVRGLIGHSAVSWQSGARGVEILPDSGWTQRIVGAGDEATQPWWLAQGRREGVFRSPTDGIAEDRRQPPAFASVVLGSGDSAFIVDRRAVYRYADPVNGEIQHPVVFAPAVSVLLDEEVEFAPAGAPLQRTIRVHVRSAAEGPRDVVVSLSVPEGMLVDSVRRRVTLPGPGAARSIDFHVRGRLPAGRHVVDVAATIDGERFTTGYTLVDYEHISPQRLYRPSRLVLEAIDARVPAGLRVAYIAGVGDNVAPVLQQLGVDVTMVAPEALPRTDLGAFGAVVVGPRAYEASPALVANNGRLLEFARDGGTLVVQYGQYEMTRAGIMPYPITINRPHDRVTIENAPVRIVDSTASVLRAPNRITASDFAGWQQDRSLYMPRTFDQRYQPVIEINDPGEPPNRGAILVAPYGKGTYVYTTLAFFRQLPNGVPGAARLFLNLLSARASSVTQ